MANNPIFPFYVNDFEGGTRHMTDAEVGCYLRLLLAQFNRGGQLPSDEKLLARYCTTFNESWPIVKEKFEKINGSKLQNKRLEKERVKREVFVESRSKNKKGKTKRSDNHVNITSESSDFHLGKGKGKGNGNGLGIGEDFLGKSENPSLKNDSILPRMHKVWLDNFPSYTSEIDFDYPALRRIAEFIFKQAGLKNVWGNKEYENDCVNTFTLIATQVKSEVFWADKPLQSISKNIQEFYNKIKSSQNGESRNPKATNGKLSLDKLKEIHAKSYGVGQ